MTYAESENISPSCLSLRAGWPRRKCDAGRTYRLRACPVKGRRFATVIVAMAVAACWTSVLANPSAATAGIRAAASGGTWHNVKQVPGFAALNQGREGSVSTLSCTSVGYCSAGGTYTDKSGNVQAYLVDETGGIWGSAKRVRGVTTLNQGGYSGVSSVSCASAGNCSAGGVYSRSRSSATHAFVVSEKNGVWGNALQISGLAILDQGKAASTNSLSCPSPGNCTAGGTYVDGSGDDQVFIATETKGIWGSAQDVPGLPALDKGGYASLESVSCASAGNCSADGTYSDSPGHYQAFVISETKGRWGDAKEVPGLATLNQGGYATIAPLSCPSARNCSTGGRYQASNGDTHAYVVSETKGVWGAAEEVPGTANLSRDGATVYSVGCASAGNCSAGGFYLDGTDTSQAFVVNEIHGIWGAAEEVPGSGALNEGPSVGNTSVHSISCAAVGNCGAVGIYMDSVGNDQVFVVSEADGTWGTAEEAPGLAALDVGGSASISALSCPAANHCIAGGEYTDATGRAHAFFVSQT